MILGANPAASQGSMLSAPDVMGRLAAIRTRGGTVIVVDPRRTPTAQRATEWVPIRPGTDALLLFAILRTLAEQGASAGRPPRRPGHGLDEVDRDRRALRPGDGRRRRASMLTTIRNSQHDLAPPRARSSTAASVPAHRSSAPWRPGWCSSSTPRSARWTVLGGAVFPKPAVWSPMFMKPPDQDGDGWQFGRFHSRVRGAPEVFSQFPISCLAEEIDTPGEGQLRGLITVAGNPAMSAPGRAGLTPRCRTSTR